MTHSFDDQTISETHWDTLKIGQEGAGILKISDPFSDNLKVTNASNAFDVTVADGYVKVGDFAYNYGGGTVTLSSSDSRKSRIDAIVYNGGAQSVNVREGNLSNNPSPPDIKSDKDVPLALVYVAADANYITSDDIKDIRVFSGSGLRTPATDTLNVSGEKSKGADIIRAYAANKGPFNVNLNSEDEVEGNIIYIKDAEGAAGTDNIVISPAGSTTIDGAADETISTNYGYRQIVYTGNEWLIIGSN